MEGTDSFHPQVITESANNDYGIPFSDTYSTGGANLRTVAAMHFMAAMIGSELYFKVTSYQELARKAFDLADVFVETAKKQKV